MLQSFAHSLNLSGHSSLYYEEVSNLLQTEDYKLCAAEWLGGAVREPTESYDDMGPIGEDSRWETFGRLHDYLLKAFPLIHANLTLLKVNTYGLVHDWQGSDSDLKPLLLTTHQGEIFQRSEIIYTEVCTSTVETVLEKGFKPKLSVILAFGFDKEASGLFGAHNINKHLLANYGENGFAMLIDKGGKF
ncbi:hypothetical protein M422DRAFT_162929 [Sphaerobolus stellatus SS14]|nr:hypothetical protein M422DRAFT_162929 [Sphaerobolus stellatus SS14]